MNITQKLIECRKALREIAGYTAGSPLARDRYINGVADRALDKTSPFDKDAIEVDFPSDVEPRDD